MQMEMKQNKNPLFCVGEQMCLSSLVTTVLTGGTPCKSFLLFLHNNNVGFIAKKTKVNLHLSRNVLNSVCTCFCCKINC